MIFEIIMYALQSVINFFGQMFPGYGQVPLPLPFGIDSVFAQGVQGYKILAQSFPPFNVILAAGLAYLGFRIGLQLLKAVPILGRTIR